MRHRASPAAVGAFVLGAVVLALGGIVLLGSKDLFRKKYPFVAYFETSVNGLRVGAPVKFKGVEIGKVDEIRLPLTSHPHDPPIVVFFSLDAHKLRSPEEEEFSLAELQHAIDDGLRVRLEQESFVTGLLFLSMENVPESEAQLHGPLEGIPEIPTAPSEFEQLASQIKRFVDRLEDVDLAALVNDVQLMIHSVADLVRSEDLQHALVSLNATLVHVSDAAVVMKQEIGPLIESLQAAVERFEAVGTDLEGTGGAAREALASIESLAGALERSTEELTSSVEATLQAARAVIDPASPPLLRLDRALAELGATARSARALLELLERDPAALVRGRATPEEER